MSFSLLPSVGVAAGLALAVHLASATTFTFGNQANNLNNAPAVQLASGDFLMHLAAGPPGSGLNESNSNLGLGVDSTAVLMAGGLPTRFERLNGVSEYVEFSFDRAGTLEGLNFDGVKDESFEYFLLESSNGLRINFFDSFANTTVPGAIDHAIAQGVITGQVVYLLEDDVYDDEAIGLGIPFQAGDVFRLSIHEVENLGPPFEPLNAPNGARLQGITVAVPEPGTTGLTGGALLTLLAVRRRSVVRR